MTQNQVEEAKPEQNQVIIRLENVTKVFGGTVGVTDVNLPVDKGEFLFLVGPTGSGKTTIFRLLIRELTPTKGSIQVLGIDLIKLPQKKIPAYRKKIGVVFQNLKLLLDRTISENIMLPLEVVGKNQLESKKKAEEVMSQMGIYNQKDKFPVQLSGGELQRVAIARALVLSPEIILADEPTGNLDPKTGKEIVDLLSEINKNGTTVLMATHNMDVVNAMNKRVVELESGKIIRDEKRGKYESA